ncbi:hypothetical protein [Streptosporangium vulgare]|uniref:Integrase catalytic domain-containing protein n=1 Tax=Streptosporangium vulgare TaxID=46190 RepID=A0ABV5TA67_9ACTN
MVAVGNSVLTIAWHLLSDPDARFHDLGAGFYESRLNKDGVPTSPFPGFGSVEDARLFCQEFYAWYNHEHHHSGVGCHRPVDVHYGRAVAVRDRWAVILAAAQAAHPGRHTTGGTAPPTPPDLPGPGWINKPKNENQKDTTEKPTQN